MTTSIEKIGTFDRSGEEDHSKAGGNLIGLALMVHMLAKETDQRGWQRRPRLDRRTYSDCGRWRAWRPRYEHR